MIGCKETKIITFKQELEEEEVKIITIIIQQIAIMCQIICSLLLEAILAIKMRCFFSQIVKISLKLILLHTWILIITTTKQEFQVKMRIFSITTATTISKIVS